ncbi:inositol monophosphatase family protein [Halomicrobium urmianum]|uniref:inositol monophosphatase family protein n=1 Tax=Halomicrobium urmianum TaxID=1586233 RepID=UPI001CDA240D|nr:inositol monophosphatase [Halomicrobium urmianum]
MSRSETVLEAAQAGAAVAMDHYRSALTVETKDSKTDYVSEGDVEAQREVVEVIRSSYPDATIVGEEEDELKTVPEDGNAWIIDPIDGTTNFVHEIPLWTTSVGLVRDGTLTAGVSVAPALDHVFYADESTVRRDDEAISTSDTTDLEAFSVAPILRYGPGREEAFGSLLTSVLVEFGDLRRLGCAQITLAFVAAGSLDAAVSALSNPSAWDTVAGVHMIERAGGTVTDIHGDPWEPGCEGIVATNGEVHDEVLDCIGPALEAY